MATTRPDVLDALESLFGLALPAAELVRNGTRPETIGKGGAVVMSDGDPDDPEVLLGDPRGAYLWSHAVEVEVCATRAKDADRTEELDRMIKALSDRIDLDPTLGGRCDSVVPALVDTDHEGTPGAATVASALIRVTLEYQTHGPLGY